MNLKPKRAVLWLGIALLAAGNAGGETWKGRSLRFAIEQAALRLGPLRIQPLLYLTDAGYDSNIYSQVDPPVPDYWLQAGPVITVYVPVRKKVVFSVSESPRYVYFFKTKEERTWNNYLQGEISLLFNRLFVSGGGLLNNYKYRYPFEIEIWPRLKERGVFGSLLFQAGKRTSFSVEAKTTAYEFENLENEFVNLQARLNRSESFLLATAYFQVTPRVMFSLSGEYGLIEFVDAEASYGDSEIRTAYLGIDFSPLGKVRGSVKIGYKELSPLLAGRSGFAGVVGNSSVSLRVARKLTVRGQYGRDVYFSVWYDNAFFVSNRYGAGVSLYVLRKKVRLDYDYGIQRDAYGSERSLDMLTRTAGVFFRLGEKMGIGIRAGSYYQRYNYNAKEYRRAFVGLNLTYDY